MRHIRLLKRQSTLIVAAFAVAASCVLVGGSDVLGQRSAPSAGLSVQQERGSCSDAHPDSSPDALTDALYSSRTVSPEAILGCERATITVTLGARCEVADLHVVVSFDHSQSMADGNALKRAKEGVRDLLQELDIDSYPGTRVGLVTHGAQASSVDLSDKAGAISSRVLNLKAAGNEDVAGSIDEASKMFVRTPVGSGVPPRRVIVVFTDGVSDPNQKGPAIGAARKAHSQGVEVISVCFENGYFSCPWTKDLASASRLSMTNKGDRGMNRAFRTVFDDLRTTGIVSLSLADILPVGLSYVEDSAKPSLQAGSNIEERTLAWRENDNKRRYRQPRVISRTLQYEVEPTDPLTTTVRSYVISQSSGTFEDNRGFGGPWRVPTSTLRVLGPCPLRIEPTPPPRTPPVPPSPPDEPSPTPTPAWTPPAGLIDPPRNVQPWPVVPAPSTVYLPILDLEYCRDRRVPVDTVLLIDVSESMRGAKLDAAKKGATLFVNSMRSQDRTALITFADDARSASTHLRSYEQTSTLRRDIRDMQLRNGTNIAGALTAATELLDREARTGRSRQPVIVLLTDGDDLDPSRQTAALTIAKSFVQERQAGYRMFGRLFTVAVGPNANRSFLAELSWDPADALVYEFPLGDGPNRGKQLVEAFERIAGALPCPIAPADLP